MRLLILEFSDWKKKLFRLEKKKGKKNGPIRKGFKCQIKPVLTVRRSPSFNCNILNPDKFTYKSHKPTCQSNKLHQLTTIHTLIFIIQRMLQNENVLSFLLICELENENVKHREEQYNQPRQETGWIYIYIHTHTHRALEFNVIVLLQEDWRHQALHLPDAV